MYTILVCDDDRDIVKSIEIYLRSEGFNVIKAYDGIDAIKKAKSNVIHCIVIDVMMPNLDGLAATVRIREKSNVPIICLSAKNEDTDKIAGLGFGADDYMSKPFNPMELIARIKSQIRRYVSLGNMVVDKDVITTGGLTIDTKAHTVTVDGRLIHLTATEYGIVECLMKNLGCVLTSSQIYSYVWEEDAVASDRTVTVHVRRIREKIEIDPKNPVYIKVVWGLGYRIEKI